MSANSLYGGTYNLFVHTLPRFGLDVDLVDPVDPENFRRAIRPETKLLYAETVGNPKLDTLDIEAVAAIAHEAGIPLIVDNTMATPYLIRPIDHGADIVVHSATKFIGGHGTSIGGVVVDSGKFDWAQNDKFPGLVEPDASYHGLKFYEALGPITYIIKLRVSLLRDIGAALSPFNAFLFLQGLETLPLRMERHSTNALRPWPSFLAGPPQGDVGELPGPARATPRTTLAKTYHYRGLFGAILGFGIKGGREAGRRVRREHAACSRTWPTSATPSRWSSTRPRRRTRSSRRRSSSTAGVTDDFVRLSASASSPSRTSSPTSTRRWQGPDARTGRMGGGGRGSARRRPTAAHDRDRCPHTQGDRRRAMRRRRRRRQRRHRPHQARDVRPARPGARRSRAAARWRRSRSPTRPTAR